MVILSNEFIEATIMEYMIPSEKVAHVQGGNSLEHALLLLTKSGYSSIPVLDSKFRFKGLIGSSAITDSILGLERFEFEKLETIKVEEVMKSTVPIVKTDTALKKAISLLVDHPFLCVVNEEEYFEGIVTRRSILKQLNREIYK